VGLSCVRVSVGLLCVVIAVVLILLPIVCVAARSTWGVYVICRVCVLIFIRLVYLLCCQRPGRQTAMTRRAVFVCVSILTYLSA